jgi:hypothetical protein
MLKAIPAPARREPLRGGPGFLMIFSREDKHRPRPQPMRVLHLRKNFRFDLLRDEISVL